MRLSLEVPVPFCSRSPQAEAYENQSKHHLHRIYPFGGTNANDVMLHGSVDYVLHNGKDVKVDWAAHAQFKEVGKDLKMRFYQVYLDSAPVAQAAAS